jgi:hypothetical protein
MFFFKENPNIVVKPKLKIKGLFSLSIWYKIGIFGERKIKELTGRIANAPKNVWTFFVTDQNYLDSCSKVHDSSKTGQSVLYFWAITNLTSHHKRSKMNDCPNCKGVKIITSMEGLKERTEGNLGSVRGWKNGVSFEGN